MQIGPPNPLSRQQFAFVRCWAEGLDLAEAWDRFLYVQGAADARRARGELRELLERLQRLARAQQRPDIATLLRRDPAAIAERDTGLPTLEAFRAQQPEDFHTEAELIALYEAQYGSVDSRSPARRRQRLRERLVLALQWLQAQALREPQPADAIDGWFEPALAARLAAVGVQRLDELVERIARRGYHWHRDVPRLGEHGARRIVRWLREHETTLPALPAASLQPARQLDPALLAPPPQTAIVPLERFALPAALDGSAGSNRAAGRSRISATTDLDAVRAWLRLRIAGTHTWRAYRKEAERFLLWAVLARRKALSSLDGDDCVAYRDFLAAPGPQWTGPRHVPRWSPDWRPFEGPLAPRSAAVAITVVRSLCEWLVRRRWLDSNPWDDVPLRPEAPALPRLRALSQRQWGLLDGWLDTLPPSPASARLRLLLRLAYCTGLRLAELAAARVEWLRHETLAETGPVWSMMVLGKRQRWREVPLPAPAVAALREAFVARGLSADLLANPPATPLVATLARGKAPSPAAGGGQPLSAARIHDVLKDAFARCAAAVAERDGAGAQRIASATTHWLRHTHGSHAAARGVPQDVLQANLGHQSLATTSIYVKPEMGRRHRALQAAFGGEPGPVSPLATTAPAAP